MTNPLENEKYNILVVDDEPSFQFTIREVLHEEGFNVCGAENGRAALDYLGSHTAPTLIILDLMMPVMNGFEFLKQREKNKSFSNIPVLVITAGRTSTESISQGQVSAFLKKPFKLEIFLKIIDEIIKKYDSLSKISY